MLDGMLWLWQVLKYSEILTQLESARQDGAQVSRDLDASRAETQAAKLSTDAVAADKARTEDRLSQHLEEHQQLNQVAVSHSTAYALMFVISWGPTDRVLFMQIRSVKTLQLMSRITSCHVVL